MTLASTVSAYHLVFTNVGRGPQDGHEGAVTDVSSPEGLSLRFLDGLALP